MPNYPSRLAYFDYAAATPTDPKVAEIVASFSTDIFANPASAHGFGAAAESGMEERKEIVAKLINSKKTELVFTSSGTESNNLAILGVAKANKTKGNHIITTTIEHPSILNTCRALEREGYEVTYLPVEQDGLINLQKFSDAITDRTILVTTHFGNSELGLLQPINEIGSICRKKGIYFHVDACQAIAYVEIDVQSSKIDLLTFNGSKMYGPKGVAVLYIREGVQIFPIIYGGGQQQSLRSGTENVPGIVGFGEAAKIIMKHRDKDAKRISALRDIMQKELETIGAKINVKDSPRLPNHLSVTFPKTQYKDLVHYFDTQLIGVSSGSACSASSMAESYVLQAIGLTSDEINRTIRITLGRPTTAADCRQLIKAVQRV